MPRYTFAELLTIFFHLHQDVTICKTQADLAEALSISRRTVSGWFAGNYLPRSPEVVLSLAQVLSLTTFQTDLLLYTINSSWTRYGTPVDVLKNTEILRYRETDIEQDPVDTIPAVAQIESLWPIVFAERFESNYQRWGVGVKKNGMGRLVRSMSNGRYQLSLENHYHEDMFMGGDSACFAPPLYYLSVKARLIQNGHRDNGYGIMFEELSDEAYGFLRVREQERRVSVIQTFNGGDQSTVFLRRVPAPSLQLGTWNRLAILAILNEHWFYINDTFVGHCVIPRLSYARLDVGIIAAPGQHVSCEFTDFFVRSPQTPSIQQF